jgi:sulfur-carrier protein
MSTKLINITILFFASTRELTGLSSINIQIPEESTCKELKKLLEELYSLNFERDRIGLAVNKVYCDDQQVLKEGDTVACIPPIAGG